MEGATGTGSTLTVMGEEATEQIPPLVAVTEKVPDVSVVMDPVVWPSDHNRVPLDAALSSKVPPSQKVNGPLAVITGVEGYCTTLTVNGTEDAVQPEDVTVTW